MLTVWGRTNSVNVQKVMWAVAELGLEHERIDAGGAFGGLDTPEYGAMNPNRKIPTVRDGDVVVWESNACVRYLAGRYGLGSLCPEDPARRALADAWMDWQLGTLLPDLSPIFWNLIRTPEAHRDMGAVQAAAGRIARTWQILDDHLAGPQYVAGTTHDGATSRSAAPTGATSTSTWSGRPAQHAKIWFRRSRSATANAAT
jgi:glutathione S-transferase